MDRRRIPIAGPGGRYWAIAQLQGASAPLYRALDLFYELYEPGDKFVFLGSQIGPAGQSLDVMAALLSFRQWVDAQGSDGEVVWLKGIQEALLERFVTLHQSPEPRAALAWMCETHGFAQLLAQLDCDPEQINAALGAGTAAFARALGQFREHLYASLQRATYLGTCERALVSNAGSMLFVHGGLDPARSLALQTDAFWWGHPDYFRLSEPVEGFQRLISTLNPTSAPRLEAKGRLAIDGKCLSGGPLLLSCFDVRGQELASYEV